MGKVEKVSTKELAARLNGRGTNRPGGLSRWLTRHPHAEAIIKVWLEKRRDNETEWSPPAVKRLLEQELDMPQFSDNAFLGWIKRHYGDLYEQGS